MLQIENNSKWSKNNLSNVTIQPGTLVLFCSVTYWDRLSLTVTLRPHLLEPNTEVELLCRVGWEGVRAQELPASHVHAI